MPPSVGGSVAAVCRPAVAAVPMVGRAELVDAHAEAIHSGQPRIVRVPVAGGQVWFGLGPTPFVAWCDATRRWLSRGAGGDPSVVFTVPDPVDATHLLSLPGWCVVADPTLLRLFADPLAVRAMPLVDATRWLPAS